MNSISESKDMCTEANIQLSLVGFMVLNTTFNNISVISWRSVILVGETTDLPQVTDILYHIALSRIRTWGNNLINHGNQVRRTLRRLWGINLYGKYMNTAALISKQICISMATSIWPIMEFFSHNLLNRKIPSSELLHFNYITCMDNQLLWYFCICECEIIDP